MNCVLLAFVLLLSCSHSKLVFTGSDLADDILLKSNLTVIIKPHCQKSQTIVRALEEAKIDYNVLQSTILVCTFLGFFELFYCFCFQGDKLESLKEKLSKLVPRKPRSQTIPAVICNKRYIGGINRLNSFLHFIL